MGGPCECILEVAAETLAAVACCSMKQRLERHESALAEALGVCPLPRVWSRDGRWAVDRTPVPMRLRMTLRVAAVCGCCVAAGIDRQLRGSERRAEGARERGNSERM